MLDENLPSKLSSHLVVWVIMLRLTAFYINPSTDDTKHNATIYLAHRGAEAEPAYSIRHPDPSLPASKNRYAAALFDSYNPEILFGEVLLIPQWTQPNPTQEEIRLNGGVPPPPQPILPTEFTVQLYNPDQQVVVKQRPKTWNSASYWEFEMPQQTFRRPSASALDRTQNDPTAADTTPKINFKWKKEGTLSKDLVCSLSGKSTNPDGSKRKNREPDITIAIFKHLREITIYEPNMNRVDMEDPKGLEIVLLLSAAVIRDVYYAPIRETFNIVEAPRRRSSGLIPSSKTSSAATAALYPSPPPRRQSGSPRPYSPALQSQTTPSSNPIPRPPPQNPISNPRPPPTDPRSQWELDAETARLRKQVEAEERERKRAEHKELKRLKKMLEDEEREARRKQAEIDQETERLRREYADEPNRLGSRTSRPPLPQRLDVASGGSSGGFYGGGASSSRPDDGRRLRGKMSIFSLRSSSGADAQKLAKKRSAVF